MPLVTQAPPELLPPISCLQKTRAEGHSLPLRAPQNWGCPGQGEMLAGPCGLAVLGPFLPC